MRRDPTSLRCVLLLTVPTPSACTSSSHSRPWSVVRVVDDEALLALIMPMRVSGEHTIVDLCASQSRSLNRKRCFSFFSLASSLEEDETTSFSLEKEDWVIGGTYLTQSSLPCFASSTLSRSQSQGPYSDACHIIFDLTANHAGNRPSSAGNLTRCQSVQTQHWQSLRFQHRVSRPPSCSWEYWHPQVEQCGHQDPRRRILYTDHVLCALSAMQMLDGRMLQHNQLVPLLI